MVLTDDTTTLSEKGYIILPSVFNKNEIEGIENLLSQHYAAGIIENDYGVRQLMRKIPLLKQSIFTDVFRNIIKKFAGKDFFLVRSIYFNKSASANWFVSYHQDLSVHVKKRTEFSEYTNWTMKDGQIGVQPPRQILESTLTVRIHLDDCKEVNGALKVIEGSHLNGVSRFESGSFPGQEVLCNANAGDLLLMKPLLLHSSGKNTSGRNRRVIHLEFCNIDLPEEIGWAEKEIIERL